MAKLLIYSGGLDSTTLLYERRSEIGLAVSFNYGSKHNEREIECAKYNCEALNIEHRVIDLKGIFKGFKSALISDQEVPEGHYESETMKSTVVPFRNGVMLSIAVALAEDRELDEVLLATHAGDHAVYPDCRPEFNTSMNEAARAGTSTKVTIVTPYSTITKEAISLLATLKDVPFDKTYSCYKGGETHCGRCSTCVERIWALRPYDDPTMYLDSGYAEKLLTDRGEW